MSVRLPENYLEKKQVKDLDAKVKSLEFILLKMVDELKAHAERIAELEAKSCVEGSDMKKTKKDSKD